MPEEFFRINRQKNPHPWPMMAEFFKEEFGEQYQNWYEYEGFAPSNPELIPLFQAFRTANEDAKRKRGEWEMMELARCHGKWIALVQRWIDFYSHHCEPSPRSIPSVHDMFTHAFPR